MYGSLKNINYIARVVDKEVQETLEIFGAIEVRGPKWCGKSWTSSAFGEKIVRIDEDANKLIATTDPSVVLESDCYPVVLDEWQDVPKLWDAVRRKVDDFSGEVGKFILTGSSTPAKDKVSHSGAGRIARIDMSTMTMLEKGEVKGGVSLKDLFAGKFKPCSVESPSLDVLTANIIKGGWPALLQKNEPHAAKAVSNYLDTTFEVSVPNKGGNATIARKIARSLARNVGTSAKLETIAQDASAGEAGSCSRFQVADYIEIFQSLYLLEELPGWDAPIKSKSRLRTKPKRYFADPSIAPALLSLDSERLMHEKQLLGTIFEALCVHDIKVFAQSLELSTRDSLAYYSDADGLEVDIIIELADGRWAGVEIKLNDEKIPEGIKNLNRLRAKVAANPLAENPEPAFLAVVTSNINFAYRDEENDVYVLPFAALEP